MPCLSLYKSLCRRTVWQGAVLGLLTAGCAPAPTRPVSTVGCATTVVRGLPQGLTDKMQHCAAAALIARHCSRTEAWLVAAGKETADVFGAGDAEWADWNADREGLACERLGADDAQIMKCCEERLPALDLRR